MSNVFFDWPAKATADRFVRFTTVLAEEVNAAFDEVSAGFDKLPSPTLLWASTYNLATATGAVNAWVASVAPTRITALTDGLTVHVRFLAANTSAAPTINLNGLGAVVMCRDSGQALAAGDITANSVATLTYNATFGKFQASINASLLAQGVMPTADLVVYDGVTVQDVMDTARPMQTYTALRAYTGRASSVRITQRRIEGFFYLDSADLSSADNSGTIIVDAAGRRWKRLYAGSVSVLWFGAVDDGVDTGTAYTGTDNTAAFQLWLDFCGLNRLPGLIPGGKYRFAPLLVANTWSLTLSYDWYWLTSEGCELLIDEDAPNTYAVQDFIRSEGAGDSEALDDHELLHLEGIIFRARWHHTAVPTYPGTNVINAWNFARIELLNCKMFDLRAKMLRGQFNGSADVTNFHGERCASGGLRFINTPRISMSDIDLVEVDDDCISAPIVDGMTNGLRQQITLTNIRAYKCEGILLVGARNVVMSNITMQMCHGTQIYVAGNINNQGDCSPHSIALSNINIIDPLNRADQDEEAEGAFPPPTTLRTSSDAAIVITGIEPSSATTGARPEFYDAVAGAFVVPYDFDNNDVPIFENYTGATNTINGGWNFVINGFNVTRTLPSTAAYSDWGLGLAFSRWGRFDPVVADENFVTHAVMLLGGGVKNAIVANGNVLGFPIGAAVYLRSNTTLAADRDREFENIIISNVNARHVKYGVMHNLFDGGSGPYSWDVTVQNCNFDCDTYHKSSARTSPIDGTWQAGIAVDDRPIGITLRQTQGWKILGNTFANCYDAVLANGEADTRAVVANNVVKCQPSAVGFSALNKGVGTVPYGGGGFIHMIYDCTPSSATYGRLLNACVLSSATIPASGTYVTGHIVRKSNPTTAASKTTWGWVRQTVGSTHVAAGAATADWAPLVIPTS